MTEKLYYKDAYTKEFSATVLSSSECDGSFDVVLDKTAFFPEEGGQSSDRGYIGSSYVFDVKETEGVIHHFCSSAVPVGTLVECKLDFDERFEKMQCHTAEHILCGIIHKLYGFENVGFHLGDDEVVFDVGGILTREQLDEVVTLANRAVFENRKVTARFPGADELSVLEYRSKLDLTENVRIVSVDGYDSCACCAPHVSYTGEIGLISVIDFQKHRGGTRIFMLAGRRAERDYKERCDVARRISALTSEPQKTIDEAVRRLALENERLKSELKAARLKEAQLRAELIEPTEKNAVVLIDDFGIPELIAMANVALERVGGVLVLLSGEQMNYKYVIASKTVNLKERAGQINSALSGRGGGKPEMIQGSFSTTLSEIKRFFEK